MTVGEPGAHGAAHAGIQGAGVIIPAFVNVAAKVSDTPYVIAVAEITAGLFEQQQRPNVIGGFGISIIVPTSKFCPVTVVCEVTVNGAGAAPKVH